MGVGRGTGVLFGSCHGEEELYTRVGEGMQR